MSKLEDVKTFGRDNEYIIELIANEMTVVAIIILSLHTAEAISKILISSSVLNSFILSSCIIVKGYIIKLIMLLI